MYAAMGLLERLGQRLRAASLVARLQRAFHRSPPAFRRGAAMLVDALIVIESFAVALLFRFAGKVPGDFWLMFWPFALFSALAFVLLLHWNGVYQSVPRPASLGLYQDVRVLSATAMAAGGALHRGVRDRSLGLRHHEGGQPRPALRSPGGFSLRVRAARRREAGSQNSLEVGPQQFVRVYCEPTSRMQPACRQPLPEIPLIHTPMG